MCPAVANQCHGSALLLYEMHPSLNIMKHFSTFTSLSIKRPYFCCDTMGPQRTARVLISRILGNQKKRHFS